MRFVRLIIAITVGLSLILVLLTGFNLGQSKPAYAAPLLASAANDAPIVGLNTVLYDGALGTSPSAQGFTFFPGSASQVVGSDGVTLTTTNVLQDGYSRIVPTLDRTQGFALRFSAQVLSEDHTSSGTADKNGDGVEDRAGFSVIAISSDGQYGLEVAFWENEIWVQEDGAAQPPPNTNTLFTHGEGVTFDTKTSLVNYELVMSDTVYSLLANGTEILSGTLRDYSAFSGFPNPYVISNYIFFGDDTTSAGASVKLTDIAVLFNSSIPDHTVDAGQPLVIPHLGGFDIDAGGDDVVLTITVNSGTLTVSDGVSNGLTGGQISGNGTGEVVLTAPPGTINTTLAFSPSLTYTSDIIFRGIDTATVTINDQGHNGTGSALINSKTFQINVSSVISVADLEVHKTRLGTGDLTAGEDITYTVAITNNGPDTLNAVVTDTFTGSVTNITDDVSGGGSCSNSGTSPIICNFANFTGTEVITLVMTTDKSFSGTLTNAAEIDFGSGVTAIDPITSNNTASVNVTVATFDLSITKSSVRDRGVSPNGAIYYTVTVNNNGPVAAPGAIISDSLPASVGGFTWTCTESGGATCANSGGSGSLNETIGTFPAGGQLQYLITATLSVSNTTITNTATVTSLTGLGDSTPGNNSATDINQASGNDIYLPLIFKSSA